MGPKFLDNSNRVLLFSVDIQPTDIFRNGYLFLEILTFYILVTLSSTRMQNVFSQFKLFSRSIFLKVKSIGHLHKSHQLPVK